MKTLLNSQSRVWFSFWTSFLICTGMVVPYNKNTEVGYREIPETTTSLKKILGKIVESHKVPFIYYVSTCIVKIWFDYLIFQENCFFFRFQHYILTKFPCSSLKFLVHKEEKKSSKNSWKCFGWLKSAYS